MQRPYFFLPFNMEFSLLELSWIPSHNFNFERGTLWVALKDEVCVAAAGTCTKPGVHTLNSGWAERRTTGLCCRHLGAFTGICGFSSSFALHYFHFFFFSFLSFSLTLLTLFLSSFPSLPPSRCPSLLRLLFHIRMESRCGVGRTRL